MSQPWDRRPAASSGVADEESGTRTRQVDAEEVARQLRALDALHARGLIEEALWRQRRAAILAAAPDTDHSAAPQRDLAEDRAADGA